MNSYYGVYNVCITTINSKQYNYHYIKTRDEE